MDPTEGDATRGAPGRNQGYELGTNPEGDAARAESVRALSTSLVGIGLALLTFTMFFLFPLVRVHLVGSTIFQLIAGVIVAAVFCFAYASWYAGRLIGVFIERRPTWRGLTAVGGLFLVIGSALLALQPALVLFAIGYPIVAAVALVFWGGLLIVMASSRKDFYPRTWPR